MYGIECDGIRYRHAGRKVFNRDEMVTLADQLEREGHDVAVLTIIGLKG
jgi:hypothetical protein